MITITNQDVFGKVVAEALAAVNANDTLNTGETIRFVNSIAKAAAKIEQEGCFMDYDPEEKKLIIWSQGSNEIYEVNGVCQCKAFEYGNICWHRTAKRLLERYREEVIKEDDPQAAMGVAPMTKKECLDSLGTSLYKMFLMIPTAPPKARQEMLQLAHEAAPVFERDPQKREAYGKMLQAFHNNVEYYSQQEVANAR